MTDTPKYRVANGDDAVGILTVLQEVAPDANSRLSPLSCPGIGFRWSGPKLAADAGGPPRLRGTDIAFEHRTR
jgi:hypothetical protein